MNSRVSNIWRTTARFVIVFSVASSPLLALDEAERNRASRLFREYRTAVAAGNWDAAATVIDTIIDDLPPAASAVAHREIANEISELAAAYLRDAASRIEAANNPRDRLREPEVVADRRLIAELMNLGNDVVLKKRLAEEGWPAIERLQRILMPDARTVIEADFRLRGQRDDLLFRIDLAERLAEKAGVASDKTLRERVVDIERAGGALAAVASASDRRIIEQNEHIAVRAEVRATEVAGVADANRIRVLAGLPALVLDPALCLASRIHSVDMVERRFFSHNSPVQGRASFGDRAREAGTTASGENIANGYPTPEAANRGWFLSPGHFRNLFGNHRRIGIGRHENHWTQLFGN